MYRILALLLILSVVVIGCSGAEPPPPPTSLPEPTEVVPTEVSTDTPEPAPTEEPTVAPTDLPPATATATPLTGVVKSTLNVRDQPTTRATLLGVLKKDDQVTLVGRTDDLSWLQINYPLGESTTAWVIAERIDTTANLESLPLNSATSPTTAATQVAAVPTVAATQVAGVPTAAATQVAGIPTASVPSTVTTTAETPVGQTPPATVSGTAEATTTAPATTEPPAPGGAPPGSILFDTFENGSFNIYKVRANGTGLQQLIPNASDPSLSPDGSRIAYRMRRDIGGLGIAVASSTGAFVNTVTEESAAGYPTWSPDGNNLGYHILPSGRLSGRIQRIGVGPDNTPIDVGIGVRPAWQPNTGITVLFDGCKGPTDCGSILLLNAFEGDPNNPDLITFGTAGAWSPNASQIAFQAPDDKGSTQIWIANANGSNRRQVTTDTGTHGMPIWSSDGAWLFYRSDQGGTGWALMAIRTNGTDARKIVDSNVNPDEWVYAKLAIAP